MKIHAIYGFSDKPVASNRKAACHDCFDPNILPSMIDECVVVKDDDLISRTCAEALRPGEYYRILFTAEF